MMVPPIGILAAWQYYRNGHVDIRVAAILCAGFLAGGLIGGRLSNSLSNAALEKIFGFVLLIAAVKMIIGK